MKRDDMWRTYNSEVRSPYLIYKEEYKHEREHIYETLWVFFLFLFCSPFSPVYSSAFSSSSKMYIATYPCVYYRESLYSSLYI